MKRPQPKSRDNTIAVPVLLFAACVANACGSTGERQSAAAKSAPTGGYSNGNWGGGSALGGIAAMDGGASSLPTAAEVDSGIETWDDDASIDRDDHASQTASDDAGYTVSDSVPARALFVASNGSDGAPGTPDQPLRTLGKAIAIAQRTQQAVYVCAGRYDEALIIRDTPVQLFGGYDCDRGWVHAASDITLVASHLPYALQILNVVGEVRIDSISFSSVAATQEAGSSIAVRTVSSLDVVISNADIVAGDGAPGIAGASVQDLTQVPDPAKRGLAGGSANPIICDRDANNCNDQPLGGAPRTLDYVTPSCPSNGSAETLGGPGGKGGNPNVPNGMTTKGLDGVPGGAFPATVGLAGEDAKDGAPAARAFGSVTREGYFATNSGQDGPSGGLGQAGGGGSGADGSWDDVTTRTYFIVGGGGGQGGAGGCGGWGGKGGGAGGASIALLSYDSSVQLTNVRLSSAQGGTGALGSVGAKGEAGGTGGEGGWSSCTCFLDSAFCLAKEHSACPRTQAQSGAAGGHGGRGGAGGPGAGGPSIPLLIFGLAPTESSVAISKGRGGLGAQSASGKAVDGASQERLQLTADYTWQ